MKTSREWNRSGSWHVRGDSSVEAMADLGWSRALRRKHVLDSAVAWGKSLVSVNPRSDVMWYSLGNESFKCLSTSDCLASVQISTTAKQLAVVT